MQFLEKDLEEIIYTATPEELEKAGIEIHHTILKRQVRIGNYGIADLIGFNKDLRCIYIYELKKEKISVSSFMQILNYYKGVDRWLSLTNRFGKYRIELIIIGKELEKAGSLSYVPDLLYNSGMDISFYTYSFKINGLEFQAEYGYKLTEEGFNL